MSDYLPEEFWPMILQKLPLKSIVQCTSVCKNWYSLITSSSSFTTHLSVSGHRPLLLTPVPKTQKNQRFSLLFDTGLICLTDGWPDSIIIWNPSIQKSVQLPKPSFVFDKTGPHHFAFGFGFDLDKNDCKVVRVVYLHEKGVGRFSAYKMQPLVEVWSLRERS